MLIKEGLLTNGALIILVLAMCLQVVSKVPVFLWITDRVATRLSVGTFNTAENLISPILLVYLKPEVVIVARNQFQVVQFWRPWVPYFNFFIYFQLTAVERKFD